MVQEALATTDGLESLVVQLVGTGGARLAAALPRDRGPDWGDAHNAAAALRRHVPLVTYKRQDFLRTGVLLCDTRPC